MMKTTLDQFYRSDTNLAYMYPAGRDEVSRFENTVPPWIEELVAMRPLNSCLNPEGQMRIVTFNEGEMQLLREMGYPIPDEDRICRLDASITADLLNVERNDAVAASLGSGILEPGTLSMAQPLIRAQLLGLFQEGALSCLTLGDKSQIPELFEEVNVAERLITYSTGTEFIAERNYPDLPFVVKLANSSSGDGVQVCRWPSDLQKARSRFEKIQDTIIIESYVEGDNIGVQFGRQPDGTFKIIGMNRQITSPDGEFMGGIVSESEQIPDELRQAMEGRFANQLARSRWTGVGSVDFISRYALDVNPRNTAMTWLIFQAANGLLNGKQAIAFNGRCFGNPDQIVAELYRLAEWQSRGQVLDIAALVRTQTGFNINAGLLFDQREAIPEILTELRARLGLIAGALDAISPLNS